MNKLLRYRVRNGYIEFDLELMVKAMARIEGFRYKPFEKLYMYLGRNNSIVNTNSVGMIINKLNHSLRTRQSFKSNVPNLTFQKQQKVDWNTVKPVHWNKNTFLGYVGFMFKETYGIDSIEIDRSRNSNSNITRARSFGSITLIINKFKEMKMNNDDIKEYIDWVFKYKSGRITVSFGFLKSDNVIQDWVVHRKRSGANAKGLSEKWK